MTAKRREGRGTAIILLLSLYSEWRGTVINFGGRRRRSDRASFDERLDSHVPMSTVLRTQPTFTETSLSPTQTMKRACRGEVSRFSAISVATKFVTSHRQICLCRSNGIQFVTTHGKSSRQILGRGFGESCGRGS